MDITMFFVFPGILITIGAVLLLLSIVLLILAFKTNDTSDIENDEKNKEDITNINIGNNVNNESINMNDGAVGAEPVVEKEEQVTDNSQDEKDLEDGFDLTKVFEISDDKTLIEKDVTSIKKSQELNTKDTNSPEKTLDENSITNNQDEEEIELL